MRVNGPHREGNNVLILHKLETPRMRLDKRTATYSLEYLWLNANGGVQGSDYTLLTSKEAAPMLSAPSLFAHAELIS